MSISTIARNYDLPNEKANRVKTELVQYVDVAIGNEEHAGRVFGIKVLASDVTKGELLVEGYLKVARELMNMLCLEKVAITLRASLSAYDNNWSATLCDGHVFYQSGKYHVHILDRVG